MLCLQVFPCSFWRHVPCGVAIGYRPRGVVLATSNLRFIQANTSLPLTPLTDNLFRRDSIPAVWAIA